MAPKHRVWHVTALRSSTSAGVLLLLACGSRTELLGERGNLDSDTTDTVAGDPTRDQPVRDTGGQSTRSSGTSSTKVSSGGASGRSASTKGNKGGTSGRTSSTRVSVGGSPSSTNATDGTCFTQTLTIGPSRVALIVDASSSMRRSPASSGSGLSSWDVTSQALAKFFGGESSFALSGAVEAGLLTYPNVRFDSSMSLEPRATDQCVNVSSAVLPAMLGAPGDPQRTALMDALTATSLYRGTPTHDAYHWALQSMLLEPTARQGASLNAVLLTDGSPTVQLGCVNPNDTLLGVDAEPIVAEVADATNAGIRTFIVGLPGSESSRIWLSEAAMTGGTALPSCDSTNSNYCHMDITTAPDFGASLEAALAHVATAVSPCRFEVPGLSGAIRVSRRDQLKVRLLFADGRERQLVRSTTDAALCTDGYRELGGDEIELCEDACVDSVKAPRASLEVQVGCQVR